MNILFCINLIYILIIYKINIEFNNMKRSYTSVLHLNRYMTVILYCFK